MTHVPVKEEELDAIEKHCVLGLDVSPLVANALVAEVRHLNEEIMAYQVDDGYAKGQQHAELTYQRVLERDRVEIERLRSILRQLEAWDMLTLDSEGKGEHLSDAAWARKTIASGLQGLTS